MKGEMGIHAQTHCMVLGTWSCSSLTSTGLLDSAIHNVCCYQIEQFLLHVKRTTAEPISIPIKLLQAELTEGRPENQTIFDFFH